MALRRFHRLCRADQDRRNFPEVDRLRCRRSWRLELDFKIFPEVAQFFCHRSTRAARGVKNFQEVARHPFWSSGRAARGARSSVDRARSQWLRSTRWERVLLAFLEVVRLSSRALDRAGREPRISSGSGSRLSRVLRDLARVKRRSFPLRHHRLRLRHRHRHRRS